MRPLKHLWLEWIEKRRSRDPQAQDALRDADASERRDLVDALEAIPAALATLPWRKERLWPAIRAGLQAPAPTRRAPGVSRWAAWASTASLLVVFGGAWWGSVLTVSPATTVAASYLAQPLATPQLPVTPPREELTSDISQRLTLSGTPQPLPAPAQTPIISGTIFTGTVTPGG